MGFQSRTNTGMEMEKYGIGEEGVSMSSMGLSSNLLSTARGDGRTMDELEAKWESQSRRLELRGMTEKAQMTNTQMRALHVVIKQCRGMDEAARKRGILINPGRALVVTMQLLPTLKSVAKRDQYQESIPVTDGLLRWDHRSTMEVSPGHTHIQITVLDRSGLRSKGLSSITVEIQEIEPKLEGWFYLTAPQRSIPRGRRRNEKDEYGEIELELSMEKGDVRRPITAHRYAGSKILDYDASDEIAVVDRYSSRSNSDVDDVPEASRSVSSKSPASNEASSQPQEGVSSIDSVASSSALTNPIKQARLHRATVAKRIGSMVAKLDSFPYLSWVLKFLPQEYLACTGKLGTCRITVIEGRDLPDSKTLFRRSNNGDHFCVVHTGMHWWRTASCMKTSDPVWNTAFEFEIEDISHEIRFLVFDRDDYVGQAALCLSALSPFTKKEISVWLPLRLRVDINSADALIPSSLQGYVHVRLRWQCDDYLAAILHLINPSESETGAKELYRADGAETTRRIERIGIPARAYEEVYSKKTKVDSTTVKNTVFVLQEGIFGPALAVVTWINSIRSWEYPLASLLCMVLYTLLCLFPGEFVRWSPLALMIFLIRRALPFDALQDENPPERLPHAINRPGSSSGLEAQSLRSSIELQKANLDNSDQMGLLEKFRLVHRRVTTTDSILASYFAIYTRTVNAFNWSSPIASTALCAFLFLTWVILTVFPVKFTFLLLGVILFIAPSTSEEKEDSTVTRFLNRIPPARRTLRREDRRPVYQFATPAKES